MTDKELDVMMRRVLIDCLKADMENEDEYATFKSSPQHQRQMKAMLKDPLKWAAQKSRSKWKAIVQKASMILLIISLGLGTILVSSPTARATFVRWVTEWYETHIVYRFLGESVPSEMPQYEITALPGGFEETERTELPEMTSVTYKNEAGDVIYFEYGFMVQGSIRTFYTENADICDFKVNNLNGLFF